MQRGEVWWANFARPMGRRPVLLLSRDAQYAVRSSLTVALITRTIRNVPVEVPLDESDGLPARCVVNVDELITIPKASLDARITLLPPEKMDRVQEALLFALALE